MTAVCLQAYYWYELGHKRGHFASVWQRSLYNVEGLKAQPWWTPQETGYTDLVKVRVTRPHRHALPPSAEVLTGGGTLCPDAGEELEDDPGRSSGRDGPRQRTVPSRGGEPEGERRVGPVHAVAARCFSFLDLRWNQVFYSSWTHVPPCFQGNGSETPVRASRRPAP